MAEKLLTVSLDTVMRKVTNGAVSRVKKVRRVPRAVNLVSQNNHGVWGSLTKQFTYDR